MPGDDRIIPYGVGPWSTDEEREAAFGPPPLSWERQLAIVVAERDALRALVGRQRGREAKCPLPWLVVICREGTTEATPFVDEGDARAFFDQASQQWSESFLARVVIGPLDLCGFAPAGREAEPPDPCTCDEYAAEHEPSCPCANPTRLG